LRERYKPENLRDQKDQWFRKFQWTSVRFFSIHCERKKNSVNKKKSGWSVRLKSQRQTDRLTGLV